jgi:hypothetical protein
MLNSKHLVMVALLEAIVMASAVLRMALPDFGFDLNSPPHLVWLVVTLTLSIAIVVAAGLLSLAGPSLFVKVLS